MKEYLAVARGDKTADLVLRNGKIIDVYCGQIIEDDLAIHRDKIIGWGDYAGEKVVDLQGKYILPGFIDSHLHLESGMILPDQFCNYVITRGTTTLLADPHEIANVAGVEGIKFIQHYVDQVPINLFINLPSCVPPTSLQESGTVLKAEDLEPLKDLPGILGLGEVMNFYGLIQGQQELLDKIEMMKGRFIDGHAPLLSGKELNAYLLAGVDADHEVTNLEEVKEKLERGMYIMVREGSLAKDLLKLIPAIDHNNRERFLFCTDDRHPTELLNEGHIDYLIKKAVKAGLDPIQAIRMATINPAQCLGLKDLGAIGPGKRADLVIVDNLHEMNINQVYKDGQLMVEEGELLNRANVPIPGSLKQTVKVDINKITYNSFAISRAKQYRVIQLVPDQLITRQVIQSVEMSRDKIIEADVAKIIVVQRHNYSQQMGVGLVKGFGLETGAFGSSVAHDSHNIIIVGRDDESIMTTLKAIVKNQGGIAVANKGELKDILSLPIAGLISDKKLDNVEKKLTLLKKILDSQGVKIENPFMALSFLALPVIPELKITSQGLFDVQNNTLVDLITN